MSNWALLACKLGCGKSDTDLASARLMFGPQPSRLTGSRAEPYSAISSTMLGKFTASRSNVTSSAVCPT